MLSISKHKKAGIIGFGVILIPWYALCLSDNWPTSQIIGLMDRTVLKFTPKNQNLITISISFQLLYIVIDGSLGSLRHGVKTALGILHACGCRVLQIVTAC
uniref:Uncharacterized protein n=1 Tax=Salix viminalis TaxID=40686 RepID=A0A6N2N640_SALVM